jgi:hypothetical protein
MIFATIVDVVKVSKTVNAPLSFVYAWCTDFSADDPSITGSKSQRMILSKTKRRVIYAQIYDGMDGKKKVAVNIVALTPPNSWHLDYFGEEDDETADYRLRSLGKDSTKLDMVFREKWKEIAKVPTLEEQSKQTNKVWDLYVAALEKDYNSGKKSKRN